MYQLEVILCPSMIVDYLYTKLSWLQIIEKIKQHKIVLSTALVDKYLDVLAQAEDPDLLLNLFEVHFANIGPSYETSSYANIEIDDILSWVKEKENRVIVTEDPDWLTLPSNMPQVIKCCDIAKSINESQNLVNQYSFPITAYRIPAGEDCAVIAKWLGNILKEENTITIIDPYIGSDRDLKSARSYFWPYITDSKRVHIYCVKDPESSIENELKQEYYSHWYILLYYCIAQLLHDRYIITDNYFITLGYGLCFLDFSGKTRRETALSICYNDNSYKFPKEYEKIPFGASKKYVSEFAS